MSSLDQYKDSLHYQKIHQQIETLGLIEHMNHLDEYGYTVIPPDLVAPRNSRIASARLYFGSMNRGPVRRSMSKILKRPNSARTSRVTGIGRSSLMTRRFRKRS